MHTPSLDRREFLKGCGASVAIGALGPSLLFSQDAQAAANTYDTVVMVFLRGGYDGLNLVTPIEATTAASTKKRARASEFPPRAPTRRCR